MNRNKNNAGTKSVEQVLCITLVLIGKTFSSSQQDQLQIQQQAVTLLKLVLVNL